MQLPAASWVKNVGKKRGQKSLNFLRDNWKTSDRENMSVQNLFCLKFPKMGFSAPNFAFFGQKFSDHSKIFRQAEIWGPHPPATTPRTAPTAAPAPAGRQGGCSTLGKYCPHLRIHHQ